MKVLIFDYDGTIADSLQYVTKGFNYAAKNYGLKARTEKEVGELYRDNIFKSIMKLGISKKEIINFFALMRNEYMNNKIKLFPGMKKVVNTLVKNNKVFIMTSNFGNIVRKSVKINGININVILGAEWGMSKVKKLNLVKKKYPLADIFYIGDTAGDMKEANKVKVTSVAVTWGFNSRRQILKQRPNYIVNKPDYLLKILQ